MEYKDYYAALGLDKKASADDIKQAYRRLARKYHPDVSKEKDAEEKFKNLQEAYEVLKDKEKRAAYDQLGSNWKAGQDFRPPPGWDQSSQFYTSDGYSHTEDLGGFSEFFTNLFGGGGRGQRMRQSQPERGQDQTAKLTISLEDAFHGITKTVQLQLPERDSFGRVQLAARTLKVNVPAGIAQGQQLRLSGQGSPGVNGGPKGDIYLEITIEPHPFYTLDGKDVMITLPIAPWEAALGTNIETPTLGGPVGLKIAANSQGGKKLRLKGRGMPSKSGAGDQYVTLQIVAPPAENDAQRAFYQQMADSFSFNPRKNWTR